VALTSGDSIAANSALEDVTKTMGSRVAGAGGPLMAYAGKESRVGVNANAPSISTYSFSDANIRADQYLMSRRLFVARNANATDAVLNLGETGSPGTTTKKGYEDILFTYMTSDGTDSHDGAKGACHIRNIVTSRGFLGCMPNCNTTPSGTNICNKSYPPGPSFPAQVVPGADVNGGPWWDYGPVVNTSTSSRVCAASNPIGATLPNQKYCTGSTTACSATADCTKVGGPGGTCDATPTYASWPDQATVAAGGTCPAGWNVAAGATSDVNARPAGYACSSSRECTTGLLCLDDGTGRLTCQ
jgi:hypothetical protein